MKVNEQVAALRASGFQVATNVALKIVAPDGTGWNGPGYAVADYIVQVPGQRYTYFRVGELKTGNTRLLCGICWSTVAALHLLSAMVRIACGPRNLAASSRSMEQDALSTAAAWTGAVLTGTMATVIAVLAVAAIGMLTLTGRVPARRAVGIIVGCFVLFSASTIAGGLTASGGGPQASAVDPVLATTPAYTSNIPRATPYDPYAGASVPTAQPGQEAGLIQ